MEYFNLLDTPLWNYHTSFIKTSDSGDIQVDLGGNQSRWLITHMFITGGFLLSGTSFSMDVSLVDYGLDGTAQKIPYHYFADGETFTAGTSGSYHYIQFPMAPVFPVTGKLKGAYPPTSNLVIVPNGDTLRIKASGMEIGDLFTVIIKAYTRHKIPELIVTTTGGSTNVIEYTSYLR